MIFLRSISKSSWFEIVGSEQIAKHINSISLSANPAGHPTHATENDLDHKDHKTKLQHPPQAF